MVQDAARPTRCRTVVTEERPGLFEAYGVEIELMIVDSETLDVKPVCDELIAAVVGEPASEIELGDIAWSNELTLHVLELKTNGPAPTLQGLAARFHESVLRANRALQGLGARLMPGAMHPWMDPGTETELWPHEYTEVYHAFDRVFGCSGHGWANLQSTHLNLPFAGDEDFWRLHAAIRIALPLIPALAASSPFQDGRRGPAVDGRLLAYRENARRVPSVAGRVIPEVGTLRGPEPRRGLDHRQEFRGLLGRTQVASRIPGHAEGPVQPAVFGPVGVAKDLRELGHRGIQAERGLGPVEAGDEVAGPEFTLFLGDAAGFRVLVADPGDSHHVAGAAVELQLEQGGHLVPRAHLAGVDLVVPEVAIGHITILVPY